MMMNRQAPGGLDLDEYKVKLQTIDATELAAEMSLTEIEYPCILIVIGSVMSLYLVSIQSYILTGGGGDNRLVTAFHSY